MSCMKTYKQGNISFVHVHIENKILDIIGLYGRDAKRHLAIGEPYIKERGLIIAKQFSQRKYKRIERAKWFN